MIDPTILFYAINQVVNQVSSSKQSTDTPLQLQVKVLNEAIKKKKKHCKCVVTSDIGMKHHEHWHIGKDISRMIPEVCSMFYFCLYMFLFESQKRYTKKIQKAQTLKYIVENMMNFV